MDKMQLSGVYPPLQTDCEKGDWSCTEQRSSEQAIEYVLYCGAVQDSYFESMNSIVHFFSTIIVAYANSCPSIGLVSFAPTSSIFLLIVFKTCSASSRLTVLDFFLLANKI